MYAVFRETTYNPGQSLADRREFQEFQKAHASRHGYKGTIVADVGDGRFLTVTLWETADDMDAARQALGPIVESLLNPLMTSPSKLYGTGRVVINDLFQPDRP